MKHESDGDTNYNWYSWCKHQRIGIETETLGNKRKSRDHHDYSFIKIDQNTEKSPGNLRTFAVTKTPVRNHSLMLV